MCNKESFWPILCKKIARDDLINESKFVDFSSRQKNRDEITKILDAELSKKNTAEWLEVFGGIVPAAPILNLKESLENPFLNNRRNIQHLKTKRGVNISLLKTPIHLSNTDYEDKTAPELGEDTNIVLEEIGFTEDQIISFKNKGVI